MNGIPRKKDHFIDLCKDFDDIWKWFCSLVFIKVSQLPTNTQYFDLGFTHSWLFFCVWTFGTISILKEHNRSTRELHLLQFAEYFDKSSQMDSLLNYMNTSVSIFIDVIFTSLLDQYRIDYGVFCDPYFVFFLSYREEVIGWTYTMFTIHCHSSIKYIFVTLVIVWHEREMSEFNVRIESRQILVEKANSSWHIFSKKNPKY